MDEENVADIEKFKRKADQSITMHSILAQRFNSYASFCEISIWVGSTILLMLTWLDPKLLQLSPVPLSDDQLRLIVGCFSALIFVLSLLPLLLKWKEHAAEHEVATKSLTEVKFRLREVEKTDSSTAVSKVISHYHRVFDGVCKIPENQFLRLKQAHLRKVELSKFIDRNPGRYYLVSWIYFTVSNIGRTKENIQGEKPAETID